MDGSVASGAELSEGSGVCGAAVPDVCRVAVLGAPKVGKTTLTRQLLTSEYLANKDNYHGQPPTVSMFFNCFFVYFSALCDTSLSG